MGADELRVDESDADEPRVLGSQKSAGEPRVLISRGSCDEPRVLTSHGCSDEPLVLHDEPLVQPLVLTSRGN